MKNLLSAYTAIAISLFITSCATSSGHTSKTIYKSDNAPTSVKKILVVGLEDGKGTRSTYEKRLSRAINEQGGNAISLSATQATQDPLSEKIIVDAYNDTNSDVVLLTRIKSVDQEVQKIPGQTYTQPDKNRRVLKDVFQPVAQEVRLPDEIKFTATVKLIAELYTDSGEMVWQMETSSFHRERESEVIADTITEITSRLLIDGII